MAAMPIMLFAAGFGTRMGALTAHSPKPLVKVAGKALLDHALDIVDVANASPVVVNLHYRGDQIRRHLAGRTDILFSDEQPDILDTGGGLRQAQGLLGDQTVLTLNTDAVWTGKNPLEQLLSAWRPERMDCLLLLLPVDRATGHGGKPDFALRGDGRLARGSGDETHVYLGAQIIKTAVLGEFAQQSFSLNLAWNKMLPAGRAHGVVHAGGWCDVGHPAAIPLAEAILGVKAP
jgi:N-acetyl-alpha-D-muramate 1-phosphate uridylyltransferase